MRSRKNKWKMTNKMSNLRPSINNQFRGKYQIHIIKNRDWWREFKKHNSTINYFQNSLEMQQYWQNKGKRMGKDML